MKRIIVCCSLIIMILCFNTLSFASNIDNSESDIQNLIKKVNKGDASAINKFNDYTKKVIDDANNGDESAIKKLKNLDCFNQKKEQERVAKSSIKLSNGVPFKITFDDGSYVTYIANISPVTENDNNLLSAQNLYNVQKSYGWGVCSAVLVCYADNEGSNRYKCHISSCWAGYTSIGCAVQNAQAGVLQNDANPAYCYASAEAVGYENLYSWNMYMKIGVDSGGGAWLVY